MLNLKLAAGGGKELGKDGKMQPNQGIVLVSFLVAVVMYSDKAP